MWMIDPRMLCNQHLLGEHGEMHKWLPHFQRGYRVHGRFFPITYIQFHGYLERHDALAKEMTRRGMNHKSPMPDVSFLQETYPDYMQVRVDTDLSYRVLLDRCTKCFERT